MSKLLKLAFTALALAGALSVLSVEDAHAANVCGDGACTGSERCSNCPEDCCSGPVCGDNTCDVGETCTSCSADCGSCPVGCGDGICSDAESCTGCSADCGACPGYVESLDFASCPAVISVCDETTTSCCRRPFGAFNTFRPVIIPMDRCHQPINATTDKFSIPGSSAPRWCVSPGQADPIDLVTGQPKSGMIYAYGLVYRLMQAGIPVHWAINPTKDPQSLNESQSNEAAQTYSERDVDFWVLGADDDGLPPAPGSAIAACGPGCTAPVVRLNPDMTVDAAYGGMEFPVRGGAFVIAGEDRERFNAFMRREGEFAGLAGNPLYDDFQYIDMYEVQDGARLAYQSFRTAVAPYPLLTGIPVAIVIDYEPPRLAVQAPGGPAPNWLSRANLNQAAAYPDCLDPDLPFSPADAVYCPVTDADIAAGALVNGDFTWAWTHAPGLSCAAMNEIETYMTADPGVRDGRAVMFMEQGMEVSETCSTGRFLGAPATGVSTLTSSAAAPYVLRYPASMIGQIGDVPAGFANGSPNKWTYDGSGVNLYNAQHYGAGGTLVRLVSEDANTTCSPLNKSNQACDRFTVDGTGDTVDLIAYLRHDDVAENGLAFYATGNNVNPQGTTGHLRMMLNAFISLPTSNVDVTPEVDPPEPAFLEVARSAPVHTNSGTVYAGTFERANVPDPPGPKVFPNDGTSFEFPHIRGHFRGIDETAIDAPLFDVANGGIPAASPGGCSANFSGNCRTVFTNVTAGARPDLVFFTTNNASILKPLLEGSINLTAAQVDFLIGRVLQGAIDPDFGGLVSALGGVDRSTSAIIGPSPLAGTSRPTMAYFGATDGGLHAVCLDTVAPCQTVGQELWWYIPRTQLGQLRLNLQRIDGSPNVTDLFGDFDGNGLREWRTILTFQTGSGEVNNPNRAPSVLALDITNPADPTIVWDYEASGVGLTIATGPVRVGGELLPTTFVQTNRGDQGAGFRLVAIDSVQGTVRWVQDKPYAAPRTPGNPAVPASGIPGGVAAADANRGGTVTHVVAPSLYGDVWVFDATNGQNIYGTKPLFRFSTDFHPIGAPVTLFREATSSNLAVLFGSGGYADPFNTAWSPPDVNQFAVAAMLESNAAPIDESPIGDFGGDRVFVIDLGNGNRAFVQALVVGNEVFIVTDSQDANLETYGLGGPSGELTRYSLADTSTAKSTQTLTSGAGGIDVSSTGAAYAVSGSSIEAVDAPTDFDNTGSTTELVFAAKAGRQLWLGIE